MALHSKTRRTVLHLLGLSGHEVLQTLLHVELSAVQDVRGYLSVRGAETYPEGAASLDIDDDVSVIDFEEGVLTYIVDVCPDVPRVDYTVHAAVDNVESGHTLIMRNRKKRSEY